MKTTRLKVTLPTITTRAEAESVMSDLAEAVNDQRKLIADRDTEILTINEHYAPALSDLALEIQAETDTLRAWAESSPDAFPKGRKSLELLAGVLGFRTGTPKLSLLSRAFNWERVQVLVEQYWPGFIRLKKEVDKEGLLSLYSQAGDKPAATEELKRCGLRVVQVETFYIEPKLTEVETRQTQAQ